MSYTKTIIVMNILWLSACATANRSMSESVSSPEIQQTSSNEEIDMSGAIILEQTNIPQYLDQLLFIGITNTALEEPLVERSFVDDVRVSKVYQDLQKKGLQSQYILTNERKHYFNYKAFREELVHQGLVKKFGL